MADSLRAYAGDLYDIARYTRLETRRAYRDVGPYTAAHVAVAVSVYLLRLWWRDRVRGGDSDRAQLASTPLPLVLAVVLLVGAIVVNQIRSELAAADGPVTTCGLCHVDWRPAVALLVIGALVVVAKWVVGGPKWPPEGDGDE